MKTENAALKVCKNKQKIANKRFAFVAVTDSGAGGLAILKKLKSKFKNVNFLYVSDCASVPYGNKTENRIRAFCKKNAEKAIKNGAIALVVACNTMSRVGKSEFLKCGIPCFFVEPDFKVLNAQKNTAENCALFCTAATAGEKEIKKAEKNGKCSVFPQKTLAKQIEKNIAKTNRNYKIDSGENLCAEKFKTVFLSCTHYILIKSEFEKVFKNAVFYDGSENTAVELGRFLSQFKTENNPEKQNKTKNFTQKSLFGGRIEFIGSGKKRMKSLFLSLM